MSNITFVKSNAKIKWTAFSDGTETCKIVDYPFIDENILNHIQCDVVDGTRDLVHLGLVKDALERLDIKNVILTLSYIPQARADRVFETGQPLPIKVFCNILNSFGFSKVYVYDPHSDVSTALINNVEVITQTHLVKNRLRDIESYLGENFKLVAPDLGATKKIFDTVQYLGHKDYIQAIKIRDVTTGEIVKCDLLEDHVEGNVLIVDDICDGGASFKFLAQKLKEKGASKVGLYVTHGIFSKGLEVLEKDIDFIFCPSIVGGYVTSQNIRRFNER